MDFTGACVDEEYLEKEMEAQSFYGNIELYHGRVDKILKLIRDYFDHRQEKCNKQYMAVKLSCGEVTETSQELECDVKDAIEYWARQDNQPVYDAIYTIDFQDKIFFCKIFEFGDDNSVLAGYVLEETALVRTFISKFSEQRIQEKYERILAIT